MSLLESVWEDAQKQLREAKQAEKNAIDECHSLMLVIAARLWNVKPGDVIMYRPHGKEKWKKAKVHELCVGSNWFCTGGFSQFSLQPWLWVFPINKDGTFSRKAVNAYPTCWKTIDATEKGGEA